MVSRSIASSRTTSSEKWRKKNGMCSVEMNEDFDLERKEDRTFIRESSQRNKGYLLREVEQSYFFSA